MKKFLVLLLVLGLVSVSNATVLDVVTDGVGSAGHLGTSGSRLDMGETINLKIVLNLNAYQGYPSYNGYGLSSIDLKLYATGNTIGAASNDKGGNPQVYANAGLSPFSFTKDATGFAQLTGVALTPIRSTGGTSIVWNLKFTAGTAGENLVNLSLKGLTEYADYLLKSGAGPYGSWKAAVESDLGDLTLFVVPEPATIALLGLGGLLLARRRK